jgi:hypothetical protein
MMDRKDDLLECSVSEAIICCCCASEAAMLNCVDSTAEINAECLKRFQDCVKVYTETQETLDATFRQWDDQQADFLRAMGAMRRKCMKCKKRKKGLMFCGGCHLHAYCDEECQRADWKRHKLVCGMSVYYPESKIKFLRRG